MIATKARFPLAAWAGKILRLEVGAATVLKQTTDSFNSAAAYSTNDKQPRAMHHQPLRVGGLAVFCLRLPSGEPGHGTETPQNCRPPKVTRRWLTRCRSLNLTSQTVSTMSPKPRWNPEDSGKLGKTT